MRYLVRFRQLQKTCCPPAEYWLARTEIVEADSKQQAEQMVLQGWRFNRTIEIKTIEEINDEQEQGE